MLREEAITKVINYLRSKGFNVTRELDQSGQTNEVRFFEENLDVDVIVSSSRDVIIKSLPKNDEKIEELHRDKNLLLGALAMRENTNYHSIKYPNSLVLEFDTKKSNRSDNHCPCRIL